MGERGQSVCRKMWNHGWEYKETEKSTEARDLSEEKLWRTTRVSSEHERVKERRNTGKGKNFTK